MRLRSFRRNGAPPLRVPFYLSLRWRLLVAGTLVWGTALALVGWGAMHFTQSQLVDRISGDLAAAVAARAGEAGLLIQTATHQVEAVAAAPEVRLALAERPAATRADWLRTRIVFPVLPLRGLGVLDRTGRLLVASDTGEPAAIAQAALTRTLAGSSKDPGPFLEVDADGSLDVVVPVRADDGGATAGWLQVQFDLTGLRAALVSLTGPGPRGAVYRLEPEGQVPGGSAGSVTQALPLPGLGLALVAEMPRREILAPLPELRYVIWLLLLPGMLGACVALAMGDRLVRPLGAMARTARGLADGQWETRVPVERADEFGVLATGLNRMAEATASTLEKLHTSEAQLTTVLATAPDAVVAFDGSERIILFNRAAERMFGYAAAEMLGQAPDRLLPEGAVGDARQQLLSKAAGADMLSDPLRLRLTCRRSNGEEFPAEAAVSLIRGEGGTLVIVILRDITERLQAEDRLNHSAAQLARLADHDPLTDLYNRRRFAAELERELSHVQAQGCFGAVLYLDLDHFKDVNDTLGHRAGDELLSALATRLCEQLRRCDILARLGGDEFALLLPRLRSERAQAVARRLLAAVQEQGLPVHGRLVHMTASIGIALYPEQGSTADELVTHADLALYQAKQQGRNTYCLYAPQQHRQAELESRLNWEHGIQRALAEDGFLFYAQPILHVGSGSVTRYELLLRMRGEAGQIHSPGLFLGVAERFGLIKAIDRWAFRRAVQLLAGCQERGERVVLEVNLSAKAFADPQLLDFMQREISASHIDPSGLVLEITETAAIADLGQARQFIQAMKSCGCHFALDDFGVGFGSFDYLRQLPVDYLKIDGSFIRNLLHDPVDQHLVRAMVQVAAGLGLQTIAEFVGDAGTLELLRDLGVDYAQGYFISPPRPFEDLIGPDAGAVAS